MNRLLTGTLCLFFGAVLSAEVIQLPAPDTEGGKPLMRAIAARKTDRVYTGKELTMRQLSDLMYAAGGVSRKDGRLTIPTARNTKPQLLYVVLPRGVYFYKASKHTLESVAAGDFRREVAKQKKMVGQAAAVILFVSDHGKMNMPEKDWPMYDGVHAGLSSQNISLYCASENLGTVLLGGMVERENVKKLLKLGKGYTVPYIQAIGVKQ